MTTHTRKYEPVTNRDGRIPTGRTSRGRLVRSGDETVLYWAEGMYERESRNQRVNPTSIIAHGDSIYSYGNHFEMARIVRASNGKVVRVLVNADTWTGGGWTSTGQHQGMVRSAVTVHAKDRGIEVLEIPFSVLNAAGIDFETVRPLEIRESRYTYHEIESDRCPGSLSYVLDDEGEPKYISTPNEGDDRPRLTNYSTVDHDKSGMAHAHGTGKPAKLGDDGIWRWTVQRHWMGDSIIRARSTEVRQRKLTNAELELQSNWRALSEAASEFYERWRNSWTEGVGYDDSLHDCWQRLTDEAGDAQSKLPPSTQLHRKDVSFSVTRWATYLSSFDYDEPHRPYFFCELPFGSNACTVDDGFASLMPEKVSAYIAQGRKVLRQGDVYAIPMQSSISEEYLCSIAEPTSVGWWRYVPNPPEIGGESYVQGTKDVLVRRRFAKEESYSAGALDIFGSNHQVTHLIVTKDGRYFGRGRMYHSPSNRPADHRVVTLEEGVWYEFVKNTVPTMHTRNAGRQSAGNSWRQSGQSRAWSVGGGVD